MGGTHPVQQRAFHNFMKEQFASLSTWLDVVSFEAEFAQNQKQTDDVVFVDVGGGNGSQCAALRKSLPELKGRLVLQNHPYVLEKAIEVEGMEKMPYDFFTEQPIKGRWKVRKIPITASPPNLTDKALVSTTSARFCTTLTTLRASESWSLRSQLLGPTVSL